MQLTDEFMQIFICEWMGAVQEFHIFHSRGINDVLRKFGKTEPLDVICACDDEYLEMKPTRDVQSNACTWRSEERRKNEPANSRRGELRVKFRSAASIAISTSI